jgi:hypothetical protein
LFIFWAMDLKKELNSDFEIQESFESLKTKFLI